MKDAVKNGEGDSVCHGCVGITVLFSAKIGQFQVPNNSLQGLQEFGNEKDMPIRKRIEICKSLQVPMFVIGLSRVAQFGSLPRHHRLDIRPSAVTAQTLRRAP